MRSGYFNIRKRESLYARGARVAITIARSCGQSLLKAIQSGSTGTADLWRMLNKPADKTTLLWIPGHDGNAGNEEADACAKQAAAIAVGVPQPVSFVTASVLIRRTVTDPPPWHCRVKEVYTKTFSWAADCRDASTRRSAVLLARLRAGHTPSLRALGAISQQYQQY